MKKEEAIRFAQYMRNNNVFMTEAFIKDIQKLLVTDIENAVKCLFADFTRRKFHTYNRFEMLSLTARQRGEIEGYSLWRYEYRKTSNLRCIFALELDNNSNIPILICAFNEDKGKKKGKNSYSYNITRAIKIMKKSAS